MGREKNKNNKLQINSIDPMAQELLNDTYQTYKRKDRLTLYEKDFIAKVESIYASQKVSPRKNELYSQIYKILNQAELLEDQHQVILKAISALVDTEPEKGSVIDNWFIETRKVLNSFKRLDFSNQLPILDVNNKHDLLNYFGFAVNSLIESVQYSMLTRNALNAISAFIGEAIIVVCNLEGKVRTMNDQGLNLFGINKFQINKTNLKDYLNSFDSLTKKVGTSNWQEFSIKTNQDTPVLVEAFVLKTEVQELETKEIVLIMRLKRRERLKDNFKTLVNLGVLINDFFTPILNRYPETEINVHNQLNRHINADPKDIERIFFLLCKLCKLENNKDEKPAFFVIDVKKASSKSVQFLCHVKSAHFPKNETGHTSFLDQEEYRELSVIALKYDGFLELFFTSNDCGHFQLVLHC